MHISKIKKLYSVFILTIFTSSLSAMDTVELVKLMHLHGEITINKTSATVIQKKPQQNKCFDIIKKSLCACLECFCGTASEYTHDEEIQDYIEEESIIV
jgi:hypothetical protein